MAFTINPIQIATGGRHACLLDGATVDCWGWNFNGQTDVPSTLRNPRLPPELLAVSNIFKVHAIPNNPYIQLITLNASPNAVVQGVYASQI